MSNKDERSIRRLRLIKSPEPKLKRYEPDLEVKEMFDDIRRQHEERKRERERRGPDGKDVA